MAVSVAILGATGVVGQKAIALLQGNSKFNIIELVASDQKIGQNFENTCTWKEPLIPLPPHIAKMKLVGLENIKADFIISCLPSDIASYIEPKLAQQGKIVFSNASSFRMQKNVPLMVPEINSKHLQLIELQNTEGKIITNPNCSAVGITLALAPLQQLAKIEHVGITTLQAISGAGYPGLSALDIIGNTIPYIESEEEKIIEETKKILGDINSEATFDITAQVHRVPVMYGHTVTLQVSFSNDITPDLVINEYHKWNQKYHNLFALYQEFGRPQAAKDLKHNDMSAHIGHIKQGGNRKIINVVCLSNNLVRGAAGAAITNMEYYLNLKNKSNIGGHNVG